MRYGASTFIWVSPFSNRTLGVIDRVKSIGFDLIEICVEDPETIDVPAIRSHAARAGVGVTICGAFGPGRDLSSEDEAVRDAGLAYLRALHRLRPSPRQPVRVRAGRRQYAIARREGASKAMEEGGRQSSDCRLLCSRAVRQTCDRAAQPFRDRPRQHGGPGPSA